MFELKELHETKAENGPVLGLNDLSKASRMLRQSAVDETHAHIHLKGTNTSKAMQTI